MAVLQAHQKKFPAFQWLRSFFFQRNTADGMELFLSKEICGMKLQTQMCLLYESHTCRMEIDLAGAEKIPALKRAPRMSPPSAVKGCRS